MLTSFKRILKTGWKSFFRNSSLSIATIFIMVMVIFIATALFLLNTASGILMANLQEKMDISVYFKQYTEADSILQVKSELDKIPEVKEVEYISKEQAMERFKEIHANDPVLLES